jgi:chromosome segregation ATPase
MIMAKKPVAKKAKAKRTAAKKTPTVGTMKGGVIVGGSIKAGRDAIMGDQYNDLRQQVAQIATPAEFLARAQEAQQQIATLKQTPDLLPAQVKRIELAEAEVQEAVQEAQKEKPMGKRINETLDSAKETMEKLAGSVTAAVGLGTVLGGLGQIAIKLFGG